MKVYMRPKMKPLYRQTKPTIGSVNSMWTGRINKLVAKYLICCKQVLCSSARSKMPDFFARR